MLAAEVIALEPEQVEHARPLPASCCGEWNEKMNLTRHTTIEKFVTRDVVDSLQLAQLLEQGERVLDVGTGGGVPGVILAIARPDLKVSLCESTQKKARAVEEMVAELGLPVTVYACRAEDVLEMSTFDMLVARALAPMAKVLTWLKPYWDAVRPAVAGEGVLLGRRAGRGPAPHLLKHLELRRRQLTKLPGPAQRA